MARVVVIFLVLGLALGLMSCGSGSTQRTVDFIEPLPTLSPEEIDEFLVGRPQNRVGIGDVQRVFDRYAHSRGELIDLYRSQSWFSDTLSRGDALFVERGITFVARFDGGRRATLGRETIERRLYEYDTLTLSSGETIEIMVIYEPGQDGERQMAMIKHLIPTLEALVGVRFPIDMLTVVNGNFEINDYLDGEYIRIARCCVTSAFVVAHELAHAYWSIAPPWFNEGMADIYAVMALERLNQASPSGWRPVAINLDAFYRARKAAAESGRFPDILLPRRLASDGLYEMADAFLLDIRAIIGDQAFRAAARDIYLTSDFGRFILRDKRIQDTFMKHADGPARDQIAAMFNESIWGDDGERYRQLQELEGR